MPRIDAELIELRLQDYEAQQIESKTHTVRQTQTNIQKSKQGTHRREVASDRQQRKQQSAPHNSHTAAINQINHQQNQLH